jgi:hypothetical protein
MPDEPWKDFQATDKGDTKPWEDFGGTAVVEPPAGLPPAPSMEDIQKTLTTDRAVLAEPAVPTASAFAAGVNKSVGGLLTGVSRFINQDIHAPGYRNGEYQGDTVAAQDRKRQALADRAAAEQSGLGVSGRFLTETGRQLTPARPSIPESIAENVGAFAPAALSGPLAPAEIGLQSYGETLDSEYQKYRQQGLSDQDALVKSVSNAGKAGMTQAAIWAVLPKPLQTLVGKVTGKVGGGAIGAFLARRAGGAASGAALGAASAAGQNLATGETLGKGVLPAAGGMALIGAVTPGHGNDNVARGTLEPAAIPPGLEEAAKVLPRATAEVAKIQPETEVSNATEKGQVEGNVPGERTGNVPGGAPAETGAGGGVPGAGGETPPTGTPSTPVRTENAEGLTEHPALKTIRELPPGSGKQAILAAAELDPTKPEQLAALIAMRDKANADRDAARKAGDFNQAIVLGTRAQDLREAVDAATGTGGSADKAKGWKPDYKPPFPQGERILVKAPHESLAGFEKRKKYFEQTGTVRPVTEPLIPDVPAESPEAQPATTTQSAMAAKGINRPPDIIDHITDNHGKIRMQTASKPGSEGYYTDEYRQARRLRPTMFSPQGMSPDALVEEMRREGRVGQDFTVGDLWDSIIKAHRRRSAYFKGETPEAQADKFQSAIKKGEADKSSHVISVGDLSVGDEFSMQGEKFTVKKIDPDNGEVTAQDGRKFGIQMIPEGADIPADQGSVKQKAQSTEFTPKETLELAKPETVEEQKARLAREKEQVDKKVAAGKLQAAAAKPLTGTSGDLGQGDLLNKPEDLFAPPTPATKEVVPTDTLGTAKQVRVTVPEGATQVRITDDKGRVAMRPIAQVNKANPFRGVNVVKIEAGTIGKDGKFRPVEGEVGVQDRSAPAPVAIGAGPGAATAPGAVLASDIGQMESNIPPLEKLADAVKRFPVQKGSFKEKLRQWLDEVGVPARDYVTRAYAGMKAAAARLVAAQSELPTVTSLDRAVGKWNLEDTEGTLAAQRFGDAIRTVFKDRSKLRALANWINADGDRELLARQAALTKDPVLRKTYEDALKFGEPEIKLAREIRQYHDEMLAWAMREGALEEGVENYIHRYYPRESDPARQRAEAALQNLRFTKNFAGFKRRFYDSDFEAEQAGLKPEKDAARRLLAYDAGFRKALTARAFVKNRYAAKMPDGRPEIDVVGSGVPTEGNVEEARKGAYLIKPKSRPDSGDPVDYRGDYVSFDHPAFRKWKWVGQDENGKPILLQGEMAVHPDAAKKYRALFERSWFRKNIVGRTLLAPSMFVKQTMLALSGFHPVQIGVHAVEHKTNPFRLVDLNTRDPAQAELVEGGLQVADLSGAEHFSEGVAGSGLFGKIPILGERIKQSQDWLFKDYIPRIKMTMALDALQRNEKRYAKDLAAGKITREQLVRLTARESNAAFGEQNYRAMFRHPGFQDLLRFAFLAPDFGEARIRFPAQALTKYGGEQRMALALGALGLATVAKLLEKNLTGKVNWSRPFTVTYNGKEYGIRNVASDLYHMVTDPEGYVRNRLNPIYTRPLLEFLTGRDNFGRKRTKTQQMVDEAKQIIPISARGSVEKDQKLWESFLNAMGITERRRSAFSDVMKDVNAWKEKRGYTTPAEFVYDADKDPYHALTSELSAGSDSGVAKRLQSLVAGKSAAERNKILQHYRRSLRENQNLTGSRKHEAEYVKQLSAGARKDYEQAKAERRAMWDRFRKAWAARTP